MDRCDLLFRRYLKSIDEVSLRKLCELALLTKEEIDILVMSLSRRHDANFIADRFNFSVATFHRRKETALSKLLFRLRIKDDSSLIEIGQIVERTLFSF